MSNSEHQKPSVGRIVHYVDPKFETDQPRAAIVVFVHDDNIRVNLTVFDTDGTPYAMESVPFDIEGMHKPHTWFWPPRV